MPGITKSIKFAAPYRSRTFNEGPNALFSGRNGVVTGMRVTTSGITATIQTGVFIQQGLFVTAANALSATIPSGLTAPYFIAVSVASSIENPLETLTPTFVKRPQDAAANTTLVAEWDGQEWRALPRIQFNELILEDQIRSIKQDFVGPTDGLSVSHLAGVVTVESGSLIDQQGSLITKSEPAQFNVPGTDTSGWSRVDHVVYRRADDVGDRRVGTVEYLVGRTYDPSGSNASLITTPDAIEVTGQPNSVAHMQLDPATNMTYMAFMSGLGSARGIYLTEVPNALTPIPAPVQVASNVTDFSFVLDPDGNLNFLYTRGSDLYYKKTDTAGVDIYSETLVHAAASELTAPRIVTLRSNGGYFLHFVYERVVSMVERELWYARRSSSNTQETTPSLLVSLTALVTNPSLAKDDDDSLLFLAFENQTTNRVYLRTYDAATATSSSAPTQYGTSLELQDDTYRLSTQAVLGASGAYDPVVLRAKNKETYVLWRHDKGAGTYGIAVYNRRFIDVYGHKAILQDVLNPAEDIARFDADLDDQTAAHLVLVEGTDTLKASLSLEDARVISQDVVLEAQAADDVRARMNSRGSLMATWAFDGAGYVANNPAQDILFMGPGVYLGQAVAANEFVVRKDFGANFYDGLASAPVAGDTIVLSGVAPNNGTFEWTGVTYFSDSGDDYALVATDGAFATLTPGAGVAQFQSQDASNGYFAKTTTGEFNNLRGYDLPHTDVFLAHYRTSDSTVAVAGIGNEDTQVIARMYEFFNCFAAGGGNVSWQVLGSNLLGFDGAILLRFFNRLSTYTIDAIPAGVLVANNQVAYVQIPDDDAPATLALNVINFGAGVLDRLGKNAYPLFWNVGGVLYTRFAPYRLSSDGETVLLGDQISQQLIQWLGSGDSTPDPSNHGYLSVSGAGLLQSDDLIVAISKLDAAIASLIVAPNEETAIVGAGGLTVYNASSLTWDPLNTSFDIMVFVNGLLQRMDPTGGLNDDYRKNSDQQLEFSYTVPENARITIRPAFVGGGGGGGSVAVRDEGSMVEIAAIDIDFVGAGVSVASTGPGAVQVTIPGAGAGADNIQKIVKNETGSAIAAKKVVAWLNNGTVALADANDVSISDFAGITVNSIADGAFGAVYKSGNVPGALTALGAVPGQAVYLGETPGEFTLTPPGGPTDVVFKIGRAEPPTGIATAVAEDLYIELEEIVLP